MNAVEDAFAKLVGRHPSEQERERLQRLRDALGLADNDAFWSIVMALEHYDSPAVPGGARSGGGPHHRERSRGIRQGGRQ